MHVNDNVVLLSAVGSVLHVSHIEHLSSRDRHVGVVVFVAQVNHFFNSRLDNHLAAVITRE